MKISRKELMWILRIGLWYSIAQHFEYWWEIIVIRGMLKRKWYCVVPPFKITFEPQLDLKEMKKSYVKTKSSLNKCIKCGKPAVTYTWSIIGQIKFPLCKEHKHCTSFLSFGSSFMKNATMGVFCNKSELRMITNDS